MIALRRDQTLGEIVGNIKPVGDGVYEMRFHMGSGYLRRPSTGTSVPTIMSLNRAIRRGNESSSSSVYDERGLLVF